ncbi:hypothetical protein R6Q57_010415 [Mikania cordata]
MANTEEDRVAGGLRRRHQWRLLPLRFSDLSLSHHQPPLRPLPRSFSATTGSKNCQSSIATVSCLISGFDGGGVFESPMSLYLLEGYDEGNDFNDARLLPLNQSGVQTINF